MINSTFKINEHTPFEGLNSSAAPFENDLYPPMVCAFSLINSSEVYISAVVFGPIDDSTPPPSIQGNQLKSEMSIIVPDGYDNSGPYRAWFIEGVFDNPDNVEKITFRLAIPISGPGSTNGPKTSRGTVVVVQKSTGNDTDE